jgi:hypothetical protein
MRSSQSHWKNMDGLGWEKRCCQIKETGQKHNKKKAIIIYWWSCQTESGRETVGSWRRAKTKKGQVGMLGA